MTIAVAEKSHAVLGPSGWHTWGNCPGSVPLSDGIVSATSTYAKEGTAAHAVLEHCLASGADAEDLIGETYEVEGEIFTVDHEMADAVNSSIDIIRGYGDESSVLQVEQTVPLQQLTGEQDAEGTCDVAILKEGGKHLVIIDFKYGKGVMVYASDLQPEEGAKRPNGQLAMYSLGWLHKYGSIYDAVEKVTLVVLQPRMEWTDEYTIPLDQLRAFEPVIREAAGAVEMERLAYSGGDELTLIPGEKQCKFCKAKAICPALKESLGKSLALVAEPSKLEHFEDLTLPKKAAAVQVDESASNEKLAEFMRAVPLIEEAVKAVRAEVERRLFAGQEVPGFYLGVGRKGNRAWRDQEEVEALLRKKRLKVDEIFEKKLVSPAKAEELLKGKPKVWKAILDEQLIVQPDGKPSVCREGDKNAPYPIVSASEDFHDLDASETITKVYDARSGNGLIVETSKGETIVIAPSRQSKEIMALAKIGAPMAPLSSALEQQQIAASAAVKEDMQASLVADLLA